MWLLNKIEALYGNVHAMCVVDLSVAELQIGILPPWFCRLKAPLLNIKKWLATYLIYVLIKNISFELLQKHFFYQSIYLHRSFGLLWIFYFYTKPMIYHYVLYTNGWQLLAVRIWIKRDRTHVIKGVSIVLLESASSLCKKLS